MFGRKKELVTTNELQSVPDVKKETNTIFENDKSNVKKLIAPGGIDASYTNHIEISSYIRFPDH